MRKTITLLKSLIISCALMMSVSVFGQDPTNGGFENVDSGWTLLNAGFTTAVFDGTNPRTGLKNLKIEVSAAEGSTRTHSSTSTVSIAAGAYIHVIYWAKSDAVNQILGTIACGLFSPALSWTPTANKYPSTTYTRYSSNKQNTLTEIATFNTALRTFHVSGKTYPQTVYIDDIITYADGNTGADTEKPVAPTGITAVSTITNSATLDWTNGADAGTGLQATLILRTTNTSATAPELNDQAIYSTIGGVDGPNAVGDWTVISTSVAANAVTYTDNTVSNGSTYLYAVVHRDLAYNYSTALVSTAVTVNLGTAVNNTSKLNFNIATKNNKIELSGLKLGEQLSVYNVSGIRVHNAISTASTHSVTLPNGLYIVNVAGVNTKVILR